MVKSVKAPKEAATPGSDDEKKAQQAKRVEINKLRWNIKFVEGEIERHQQTRKELRASLEALGGLRGKKPA